MTRRYYAFCYRDGTNTTTGGEYGTPLHIAGWLWHFTSAKLRDEWVDDGDNCRGDDFRRTMRADDLPMGWVCGDAQDWAEIEIDRLGREDIGVSS